MEGADGKKQLVADLLFFAPEDVSAKELFLSDVRISAKVETKPLAELLNIKVVGPEEPTLRDFLKNLSTRNPSLESSNRSGSECSIIVIKEIPGEYRLILLGDHENLKELFSRGNPIEHFFVEGPFLSRVFNFFNPTKSEMFPEGKPNPDVSQPRDKDKKSRISRRAAFRQAHSQNQKSQSGPLNPPTTNSWGNRGPTLWKW